MVNISKTGTRPKKNSLIIGQRTLWQEEHVRLQVLGFPPAQQILFIARVWVDADGTGPGNPEQAWTAYDGANPYMDFDSDGELQTRYLYGPGIDELFARIGAGEDPQRYLTDRLGSVRQIVDAEGSILDDIIYDSFGNVLSESNPSQGDRFKFTGREFSPELGIYYYRARWYDPAIGQFISQDPIKFQGGDPNLYRYVGNAPGDGVDPSGLAPKLILRPDGPIVSVNIPEGQDAIKFIQKYYPGSIIHGSQDLEILKDPNLAPFLPQPKDPPTPSLSSSLEWSASDFFELGLGIAGFFNEPLNWVFTANQIRKDPTNIWNYFAFFPGLSIGMIKGCKKASCQFSDINDTLTNLNTAVLHNGFYETNGFRFSQSYYEKLWETGRPAPGSRAEFILSGANGPLLPDPKGRPGFFRYVHDGWEIIYNPTTKEVWHLMHIK